MRYHQNPLAGDKSKPAVPPLTKRFRLGRLSIVRTRGERKMKLGQEKRE
jgi:hypothetical protein